MRQRAVANPGRFDQLQDKGLDPPVNGLSRALDRSFKPVPRADYDSPLAYGDVLALHQLWRELGLADAVSRALSSPRRGFDAEAPVRTMVFNRLCAPD